MVGEKEDGIVRKCATHHTTTQNMRTRYVLGSPRGSLLSHPVSLLLVLCDDDFDVLIRDVRWRLLEKKQDAPLLHVELEIE